jgi:hypothetical protein
MFHYDITYAMMRERVAELHERAAADRQAARIARASKGRKPRHSR